MPSATERLGAPVQIRAASRDKRTIEIVASDFSKDSYNTRIDPNGWDVSQFIKNPVILAFHNDYRFPVARGVPETVRTERGELRMTVQFPEKGKYPEADIAFELYADGFMRGVSVGFVPLEWDDVEEGENEHKQSVRVYRRVKLLEVSLVPIPSNDNALSQRATDMNADPADVRGRLETFERMLDEKIASPDDIEKWRAYFENKQPANRAATKVLEKFYKRILNEEPPAEEVQAWERMGEAVEAMEESSPGELEPEKTPEVKPEEVTQVPKPAEAPQEPERKASVQIPLSALKDLPGAFMEAASRAVEEAAQRGEPSTKWGSIAEEAGKAFIKSLSL